MAAKRKKPTSSRPARGKQQPGQERLSHLERLIELMASKNVVEVEITEAGNSWRVRRSDPHAVTYQAPVMPGLLGHGMVHSPALAPAAGTAVAETAAAPAKPVGEVFKSPMLGTFYRAPSPEAEMFVKVGDKVSADKTICIIEAMKVMNEIKAEREFEVLEILVKNGEPVEYGQPLFTIR